MNDLLQAGRFFRRTPAFTTAVVATLALGIGGATTVFSFVNGVLLKPLPYAQPERLVLVWETLERLQKILGYREIPVSPAMAREWESQNRNFENMAAFRNGVVNLAAGGPPERVTQALVSAQLFDVLQVQPALGRTFTAAEEAGGHQDLVVLSHRLWQRRFAGARDVLGRTVRLDDQLCTVVGVMPPGFEFPRGSEHPQDPTRAEGTELWRPLALSPEMRKNFGNNSLSMIGRLKPGISATAAQSEIRAIEVRVMQAVAGAGASEWGAVAVPYLENMVQDTRPALLLISAAVGLVLLIVCVNVAGLLLVATIGRRREMAVRAALGASPARLARQMMAESLALALAGCAAGTLIAFWSVHLLRTAGGMRIPRLEAVAIDGRVLAMTVGLSLLVTLVFGLVPALTVMRFEAGETLKQGGRGLTGSHQRLRTALVAAEVALSVVLLTGAGLLARSFYTVLTQDRGFDTASVVTARIPLARYRYAEPQKRLAFSRQLLENVAALPAVESAGLISALPLTGDDDISCVSVEGAAATRFGEEPVAEFRQVSAGYFRAMRLELKQGRFLANGDGPDSQKVVVINETMARTLSPGRNPLGLRIKKCGRAALPWQTVVGVVADVRQAGLERKPRMQVYVPFDQEPSFQLGLVARTRGDTSTLTAAIRAQVRLLDPDQPVLGVQTMEELVSESTAGRRLQLCLLAAFAVFALALASTGIHGVVAYSVAQRRREFGIRMALGARKDGILRMVLEQGLWVTMGGITAGAAGALALGRLLAGFLYGVKANDGATFAAVAGLVLLCALAAMLVPARRAMSVDPVQALREE
jgi:putative ABC transport system permease protein